MNARPNLLLDPENDRRSLPFSGYRVRTVYSLTSLGILAYIWRRTGSGFPAKEILGRTYSSHFMALSSFRPIVCRQQMICPVESANDLSACRTAVAGDDAKHGCLHEGRRGAGDAGAGSNSTGRRDEGLARPILNARHLSFSPKKVREEWERPLDFASSICTHVYAQHKPEQNDLQTLNGGSLAHGSN